MLLAARLAMEINRQVARLLSAGSEPAPFSPGGRRVGDEGDRPRPREKQRGAILAPLFAGYYCAIGHSETVAASGLSDGD